MAKKSSDDREVQDIPGIATLIIPEELSDKVVEYLATLEAGDTDVSGYMIGIGLNLGTFAMSTQTLTNCKTTQDGKDELCDNDTYIEK